MKREGDYIKHPPPTLYNVESFSFVNIHSTCVFSVSYTLCLYSLSLSHIHTRTYHLFRYTESTTILYNTKPMHINTHVQVHKHTHTSTHREKNHTFAYIFICKCTCRSFYKLICVPIHMNMLIYVYH